MRITLDTPKEEKEKLLEKQKASMRAYRRATLGYYAIILFFVVFIIIAILDLSGVTSISWYAKVNKLLKLYGGN